jgi:hypothetical protein
VGTAKRGIAIKQEMQTEIYRMSRLAGISENKVIVRMLQIAREDLAVFDNAGLRRILREPWQGVRKLPALSRRMQKRSHNRLSAVTATRLTVADKHALRELARKHNTTMAGVQRQLLERTVAKEAAYHALETIR